MLTIECLLNPCDDDDGAAVVADMYKHVQRFALGFFGG